MVRWLDGLIAGWLDVVVAAASWICCALVRSLHACVARTVFGAGARATRLPRLRLCERQRQRRRRSRAAGSKAAGSFQVFRPKRPAGSCMHARPNERAENERQPELASPSSSARLHLGESRAARRAPRAQQASQDANRPDAGGPFARCVRSKLGRRQRRQRQQRQQQPAAPANAAASSQSSSAGCWLAGWLADWRRGSRAESCTGEAHECDAAAVADDGISSLASLPEASATKKVTPLTTPTLGAFTSVGARELQIHDDPTTATAATSRHQPRRRAGSFLVLICAPCDVVAASDAAPDDDDLLRAECNKCRRSRYNCRASCPRS